MVAIVILLFAWCWLPIQFFTLWYKFDPDFPLIPALLKFKIFAHTLSYANSCVNPFVYAFMNEGVRKAFQKKFPAASKYCQCLSKPKQANPETSTMIDKAVMTTRAGVDSMATTHCSLWCEGTNLVDDVMSCDYTGFKWGCWYIQVNTVIWDLSKHLKSGERNVNVTSCYKMAIFLCAWYQSLTACQMATVFMHVEEIVTQKWFQ